MSPKITLFRSRSPHAGNPVPLIDGWALEVVLGWTYLALKFALAGVFIYAGVIKLLDPKAFAHAIAGYDLLPEVLLPPVAIGLPALEVAAGVGLLFEVRGSLGIITGLLVLFLLILGYAMLQNLDIDCGCFSATELGTQESVRQAFSRDLGLMGAVLFLFWRAGAWRPLPRNPNQKRSEKRR